MPPTSPVEGPGTTSARLAIGLARRLLILYGFCLAILLHTPLTEILAQPLYSPVRSVTRPSNAIVVMEAWADDDGELNESGLKRALRAAELFRAGAADTVVVTGLKATATRTSSALAPMAQLLRTGGVPAAAVVLEDESSDTHESAVHVGALAKSRGWTRVALVTDAAHMPRAARSLRKIGLEVDAFPTILWELGAAQPSWRLRRVGILIHEYLGLAYYWWKGWI